MSDAATSRTVRIAWAMVKLGAVGFGALVLLLVVLYFRKDWDAQRAWQRYRAAAASQGAKLVIGDFQRAPVADSENLAMAPVLRDDPSATDPRKEASTFALPALEGSRREPFDMTAWRDHLVKEKWIPQAGRNPARDVLEALKRFDPKLEELRGALGRGDCQFHVDWNKGLMAAIPWTRVVVDAGRVLALRARALLAIGNPEAALQDVMDLLRMRRLLSQEFGLISGLVRNSLLQSAAEVIREGVADHEWREEDLRDLMAELGTIELLKDAKYAFESERALTNAIFDQLCGLPLAERSRRIREVLVPAAQFPLSRGMVRESQSKVNRAFDGALSRIDAQKRVLRAPTPDEEREMSGAKDGDPVSWMYNLLANVLLLPAGATENAFARMASSVDFARIGCALELFRMKNDRYPEQLDLLRHDDLLGAVPVDVWTGEPLHYAKTPKGFRLWAVGKDREDDGGVYRSNRARGQQLDWIFEVP